MDDKECIPIVAVRDAGTQLRYETLIQLIVSFNQSESVAAVGRALATGIKYVLQLRCWRFLLQESDAVVVLSGNLQEIDLHIVKESMLSSAEQQWLSRTAPILLGEKELVAERLRLPEQLGALDLQQLYALPTRGPSGPTESLFLMGARGQAFSPIDLKFAAMVARLLLDKVKQLRALERLRQAESEIRNINTRLQATLATLEERDLRIQEDLDQAQAFQQSILPTLPDSAQLSFVARYRPSEKVGGDIYDVSEIAPGKFRLFLADITGHGVQASLRTMVVKTEYERCKRMASDPAVLLSELNVALCRDLGELDLMCTACCIDLDVDRHELIYANCAMVPLLLRSGGVVTQLYQKGPFLAARPRIKVDGKRVPFHPGDRLFISSDGLYEQRNAAQEELGVDRVVSVLQGADSIEQIMADMESLLSEFSSHTGQSDDVTMLAIEFGGEVSSVVR